MSRFDLAYRHVAQFLTRGDGDLFVTGRAGTGKSTLLARLKSEHAPHSVILAPTGVAALNVGGQTIHRFFGFGPDVTPQSVRKRHRVRHPELYRALRLIIIDEVSMVRADLLDCMATFLTMHGAEPGESFGGARLLYFGDLLQLPPVITRSDREALDAAYETPYFFSAGAQRDRSMEIIELTDIYRQQDPTFISLLDRVRGGELSAEDAHRLNQRQTATGRGVVLTGTNAQADRINERELARLPSRPACSVAIVEGEFGKDSYPCAAQLSYKPGAQVMMVNNDADGRWVNGSIGFVGDIIDHRPGKEAVSVRFAPGAPALEVKRHAWDICKFEFKDGEIQSVPTGRFNQLPFRLAWAITIHKSQGKSFDHVEIDLPRSFSPGQIYVALSRCRTLEGITLRHPLAPGALPVDHRITEFFDNCERDGWMIEPRDHPANPRQSVSPSSGWE